MTFNTGERELWFARYERDQKSFAKVLGWDPFKDWDANAMPEMQVEEELAGGLYVSYAVGPDHEQAVAFFRRACRVAQRVIDEDKLTSPLCVGGLPLNRGRLYRAYTYARCILGELLDLKALEQSSRDFEDWCKGYGKGEWDSQAQANYLSAVRLSLIGGDVERGRELLKTKKSVKWHKSEHELWKLLVEVRGEELRADAAFGRKFSEYFDKLRDPGFVPDVYMEMDIVRLEMSAIRDKYLISDDGVIEWSRAVGSVPG
ncbi:MAG: hypothetical protein QOI24_4470 [Acidobacteriota bacterium]|jgi:hypothetical protein|nr:hypothetical protein [Acidobacteriota bacterium]